MNFKYRYKIPVEKIEEHHLKFAYMYAETFDSLSSYNESHKHINKVRASGLLQSPIIWDKVIQKIKTFDAKTAFQSEMLRIYEDCQNEHKLTPTEIFQIYCFRNKNTSNTTKKDADPLHVINKICSAYHFFNFIQREYFCSKLADAIKDEKSYYDILAAKNDNWRKEYVNLCKDLELKHIHLNKILNHGKV